MTLRPDYRRNDFPAARPSESGSDADLEARRLEREEWAVQEVLAHFNLSDWRLPGVPREYVQQIVWAYLLIMVGIERMVVDFYSEVEADPDLWPPTGLSIERESYREVYRVRIPDWIHYDLVAARADPGCRILWKIVGAPAAPNGWR